MGQNGAKSAAHAGKLGRVGLSKNTMADIVKRHRAKATQIA